MARFHTRRALVVAFVLGGSWAVAGDAGPGGGDEARLQGKWEARAGSDREYLVALDVVGDRVAVQITTPQGLKIRAKGEIRLDQTTSPRRLDWVKLMAGDLQALPEVQGVYKLEDDALIMCNGGFNGSRPTEFVAGDGPLAEVLTFRRPGSSPVVDGRSTP